MNSVFFQPIEEILHTERIDAYRQDGADHIVTLFRYLLNMALSESLYPALQFAEIASRNAIHRELSARCGMDAWHQAILEIIGWMSPELHDLAGSLDRFSSIRRAGLKPWLSKLQRHWPPSTTAPPASTSVSTLESVSEPFDASNGAETPFGHRWGGDVFTITSEHITAMQDGPALRLDVMNEYVVSLKSEPEKEMTNGEGASDGG